MYRNDQTLEKLEFCFEFASYSHFSTSVRNKIDCLLWQDKRFACLMPTRPMCIFILLYIAGIAYLIKIISFKNLKNVFRNQCIRLPLYIITNFQ